MPVAGSPLAAVRLLKSVLENATSRNANTESTSIMGATAMPHNILTPSNNSSVLVKSHEKQAQNTHQPESPDSLFAASTSPTSRSSSSKSSVRSTPTDNYLETSSNQKNKIATKIITMLKDPGNLKLYNLYTSGKILESNYLAGLTALIKIACREEIADFNKANPSAKIDLNNLAETILPHVDDYMYNKDNFSYKPLNRCDSVTSLDSEEREIVQETMDEKLMANIMATLSTDSADSTQTSQVSSSLNSPVDTALPLSSQARTSAMPLRRLQSFYGREDLKSREHEITNLRKPGDNPLARLTLSGPVPVYTNPKFVAFKAQIMKPESQYMQRLNQGKSYAKVAAMISGDINSALKRTNLVFSPELLEKWVNEAT
jgi:hypothetical protein